MAQGPTVKKHGYMIVTDDGTQGNRYSVRAIMSNGTEANAKFICGGAELVNAALVAEALYKANAGNAATTLTEAKYFK